MTFATTGPTARPQIASPAGSASANAASASAGTGFTGVIGEMLATLAPGVSPAASGTAAPLMPANDGQHGARPSGTLPLSAFIPVHPALAAFAQPLQPVAPGLPGQIPLSLSPSPTEIPGAGAARRETPAIDGRADADPAILPNILTAQLVARPVHTQPPVSSPATPVEPTSVAPETADTPLPPAIRAEASPARPAPSAASPRAVSGGPAVEAVQDVADPAKSDPAPSEPAFRYDIVAPQENALPAHVAAPSWAASSDTPSAVPLAPAAIPTQAQAQSAMTASSPAPARRVAAEGPEPRGRARAPALDGGELLSGAPEMAVPAPAMLLSAAMQAVPKAHDPQTGDTAGRRDAPTPGASGVAAPQAAAMRMIGADDGAIDSGRATATADPATFVPTPPAADVTSDAPRPLPGFHIADALPSRAPSVAASLPPAPPPAQSPFVPPMPVIPAQPGRIGHDLGVEIARRVSAGGDELVVRLDPAELGRIEVRMSFDDRGGLKTVIAADSPVALDMLRRDSADLGRSLSDAGFQGAGQSLRFDSGGGDRSQGQGQPRSPWHGANQKPGHADDFTAVADFDQTAYRSLRTSGRYDLIA